MVKITGRLLMILGPGIVLLLSALLGASIPLPSAAQAQTPLPPLFGVDIVSGREEFFEKAQAAGAQWVRLRLYWASIEPQRTDPPIYQWGGADALLRQAAEAGLRPMVIVGGSPQWAVENMPVDPSTGQRYTCGPIDEGDLPAFVEFLQALVNRYKGPPYNVKDWELFNEPDCKDLAAAWVGGCWGGDADGDGVPDPQEYADMLKQAYPAIKGVDPEARVLLGALAYDMFTNDAPPGFRDGGWFNYYFIDRILDHGAGAYFDVLNFHYYVFMHQRWDPWGLGVMGKVKHLRERIAGYGLSKPAVCSEVGVNSMDNHNEPSPYNDGIAGDEEQSRYVGQVFARAMAGGLEAAVWFTLDEWSYPGWGLVNQDLSEKPAYGAFQTLTRELEGYRYARPMDATAGVEGYVFESGGQEKVVLWAEWWPEGGGTIGEATPQVVSFAGDRLRVVDKFGTVSIVEDGSAGDLDSRAHWVGIQITGSPKYVETDW